MNPKYTRFHLENGATSLHYVHPDGTVFDTQPIIGGSSKYEEEAMDKAVEEYESKKFFGEINSIKK